MNAILDFKEKVAAYYSRYAVYVDVCLRFIVAFFTFYWIRMVVGYSELFSNIFLLLMLSLLCSVFPYRAIPILAGILLTGNAFALGIDIGAAVLAVLLVLLIFFLRFVPDDSRAAALMPVAMSFGLGALPPIVCGLKRRVAAVFAVVPGVIFYALVKAMTENADALDELGRSAYAERLKLFISAIWTPEMMVIAVTAAATLVVVALIAALPADRASTAAIPVGCVIWAGLYIVGVSILEVDISAGSVIAGAVISGLIAFLCKELFLTLDYEKSELLQIEDDDYYYYVKAIPKRTAASFEEEEPEEEGDEDADMRIAEAAGGEDEPPTVRPQLDDVNFEEKLEDSLREL